MTNTAIQVQKYKTLDNLLPRRGYNIYHAGIKDGDRGHERYAHPSSKHPNLTIVNPIYDDDDNVIMPGYYELILSVDRQMLVLAQAGKEIAIVPVFKLEEDKTQEEMAQPMDNKSLKKWKKEQKKQAKLKKKIAGNRMTLGDTPPDEVVPQDDDSKYMNATIEYEKSGDYYLIKYECGKIRAWGAIK